MRKLQATVCVLILSAGPHAMVFAGPSPGGLVTTSPSAGEARTIGSGQGIVINGSPTDPICPDATFKRNDDGSYENGYAWAYNGNVRPFYGAWAEGFSPEGGDGAVCGMQFALTQVGNGDEYLLDAYVWDAVDSDPDLVLSITTGLHFHMGFWPYVTQHDVDIIDTPVTGQCFVGWWGVWDHSRNGFYVGADEDGTGAGLPRTNFAPGIGYPTGWNVPNLAPEFSACKDLGIATYEIGPPTPAEKTAWGRIKVLFR
jgi:hypothetical protein